MSARVFECMYTPTPPAAVVVGRAVSSWEVSSEAFPSHVALRGGHRSGRYFRCCGNLNSTLGQNLISMHRLFPSFSFFLSLSFVSASASVGFLILTFSGLFLQSSRVSLAQSHTSLSCSPSVGYTRPRLYVCRCTAVWTAPAVDVWVSVEASARGKEEDRGRFCRRLAMRGNGGE